MKAINRNLSAKNVLVSLIAVVLVAAVIILVVSNAKLRTTRITFVDAQATSQAKAQEAVDEYAAKQAALPTPTPQVIVETKEVIVMVTPTVAPVVWIQKQVGLYSNGKMIDGLTWELVKGTHYAATTKNGFYEAVKSGLTGVANGKDLGWCKPDQFDCPPHALLVLVEVPSDKVSCLKAEMDISWRVILTNTCGAPVPVKFSIRYNDVTRNTSELKADYLALAGLTQEPLNTLSEVGLFVSVKDTGTSSLTYEGKDSSFGYSCWNCLPDTIGPDNPVPYPLTDIETFGQEGQGPIGSSFLPGVVFPLPRPTGTVFSLSFEVKVVDEVVIWAGRYDVLPLLPTATP